MTAMRKKWIRHWGGEVLLAVWLPVALLVVWWVVTDTGASVFFPSLRSILGRFGTVWLGEGFTENVLPSMANLAVGVLCAIVLGIVLGIVLAVLPAVELVIDPFLQFLRAVPAVALIPLILVIAGTGPSGKIWLIAFGSIWPVLLNTIDGVKAVHPEARQAARSFRVTRGNVFWRVLVPGAFPQISIGIRLSLSIALVVMVASELYAANQGIGYYVLLAQQTFRTADMWSGILLLGVIGYLLTVGYSAIEARILRWRETPAAMRR